MTELMLEAVFNNFEKANSDISHSIFVLTYFVKR